MKQIFRELKPDEEVLLIFTHRPIKMTAGEVTRTLWVEEGAVVHFGQRLEGQLQVFLHNEPWPDKQEAVVVEWPLVAQVQLQIGIVDLVVGFFVIIFKMIFGRWIPISPEEQKIKADLTKHILARFDAGEGWEQETNQFVREALATLTYNRIRRGWELPRGAYVEPSLTSQVNKHIQSYDDGSKDCYCGSLYCWGTVMRVLVADEARLAGAEESDDGE
ncbi:MAG: hypothetical protein ACEQSA_00095 [Weeksellaceae bacterium]